MQGPTGSAGQSFIYRGVYDPATAYHLNDVVTGSDGSSYLLLVATATGHDPVTDLARAYWSPIAIHGEPGAQGPTGSQGVPGTAGSPGALPVRLDPARQIPGASGPVGPRGPIGRTGATGPTGDRI